jgi:ankyrin repeat protein
LLLLLLLFSFSLLLPSLQGGATALIIAASNGHMDCVRLLVESGANTEAKTKVQTEPTLHF